MFVVIIGAYDVAHAPAQAIVYIISKYTSYYKVLARDSNVKMFTLRWRRYLSENGLK